MRIRFLLLPTFLGLLVAACSSSSSDTATDATQPGGGSGGSGGASGSAGDAGTAGSAGDAGAAGSAGDAGAAGSAGGILPPQCAPDDAKSAGTCELLWGVAWNGSQCVPIHCNCTGADCDKTHGMSYEECVETHKDCTDPCAGRGCGESCSTCTTGTCPAVAEYCDAQGKCTTEQPVCGAGCKSDSDCPASDALCTSCVDGKILCPEAICTDGICGQTTPTCEAVECKATSDCPMSTCTSCEDGTILCPEPSCVDNKCSEKPAPSCPAGPCDGQDAQGTGMCPAFFGYKWNGSSCVGVSGCSCTGAACPTLAQSPQACEQQFKACSSVAPECKSDVDCPKPVCTTCSDGTTICPPSSCVDGQCLSFPVKCPKPCAPLDAKANGQCKKLLGFGWDGEACASFIGCGCEGPGCEKLSETEVDCWKQNQACLPAVDLCAPVKDVLPVDACKPPIGYLWDGKQCAPFTGCKCEGKGCLELTDAETCEKQHAKCTGESSPCAAYNVSGEGQCKKEIGYFWNGKTCEALLGCECKGADCNRLSPTLDACVKKHDGCAATKNPCADKKCGEQCTSCDPKNGPCADVLEYCTGNYGTCSSKKFACQ